MKLHIEKLKKAIEDKKSGKYEGVEVEARGPDFTARGDEISAKDGELRAASDSLGARYKEIEAEVIETNVIGRDVAENESLVSRARVIAGLRILFDFAVPLGAGIYALVVLIRHQ